MSLFIEGDYHRWGLGFQRTIPVEEQDIREKVAREEQLPWEALDYFFHNATPAILDNTTFEIDDKRIVVLPNYDLKKFARDIRNREGLNPNPPRIFKKRFEDKTPGLQIKIFQTGYTIEDAAWHPDYNGRLISWQALFYKTNNGYIKNNNPLVKPPEEVGISYPDLTDGIIALQFRRSHTLSSPEYMAQFNQTASTYSMG